MLDFTKLGKMLMDYAEAQQNALSDLRRSVDELNEALSPYRCLQCNLPMSENLKFCSPECAEAKAHDINEAEATGN